VAEARSIADAATDHAKTFGVAPDEAWLTAHLVEAGKIEAPPAEADDGSGAFPTFGEAREEYLQYLARHRAEDTERSYRGFLEMPEMRALDDRRLPTITRDEIVNIVIDIHASGRESSAEAVVRVIRPCFNFFGEDGRRLRYGVQAGLLVGIKAPPRTNTDIDEDADSSDDPWSAGYVPEISELGRIIAVSRSGIMTPVTGLATELTAWTVQRRRSIASARLQDFFDLGNGTGLWRVPAVSRKGGRSKKRPHTIPLPKPIWDCVLRAVAAAQARDKDTKWLFPGARPRRAGGVVRHMHPSTLTHRFLDIPDCGASPHDVRRCMGTHGEALLGFSRTDTGAIMDHEEGGKASDKITSRTAGTGTHDVTGAHYSLHDGTHHTWPVMQAWADALQAAIAKAEAELDRKMLAREYGDRACRIGAAPAKPLVWTGEVLEGEDLAEYKRQQAVIRSRVVALGVADEDS